MTLRVTPWGKDNFKATSGEAEAKDWAYWQNRMNRASLVMLAEEGIISPDIASRIAAAQKHAEDIQNQAGVPRLTDIMPLEKMLIESCGEEATLIHTGRSRQDMFTTLNEARLRLAVLDFYEALNKLRTRLLSIAREILKPIFRLTPTAFRQCRSPWLSTFGAFWSPSKETPTESLKATNASINLHSALRCSPAQAGR